MKPWARRFYKSKVWERIREAYLAYRHGLCERCGAGGKIVHHKQRLTPQNIHDPSVTLSFDNLELLCHNCHNKEHNIIATPSRNPELAFDENGDLVHKAVLSNRKVLLITGPPLAGKTTYALQRMERGDLLVDLDHIWAALSGLALHDKPPPLLRTVWDVRDALYDHIRSRRGDWSRAFVIATAPERRTREELIQRLRAEHIMLLPSIDECLRRLAASDRPDKAQQERLVREWFDRYEP